MVSTQNLSWAGVVHSVFHSHMFDQSFLVRSSSETESPTQSKSQARPSFCETRALTTKLQCCYKRRVDKCLILKCSSPHCCPQEVFSSVHMKIVVNSEKTMSQTLIKTHKQHKPPLKWSERSSLPLRYSVYLGKLVFVCIVYN